MARSAQAGRVEEIYLRPERRMPVMRVESCDVTIDGLSGDHAKEGKRSVTLIQAEHIPVVQTLIGSDFPLDPSVLRRNILVSGLNLLGFRHKRLLIGTAEIEIAGPCPPCSRMEEVLGFGGYTAMRGHGGVYAQVISEGHFRIGDTVAPT